MFREVWRAAEGVASVEDFPAVAVLFGLFVPASLATDGL